MMPATMAYPYVQVDTERPSSGDGAAERDIFAAPGQTTEAGFPPLMRRVRHDFADDLRLQSRLPDKPRRFKKLVPDFFRFDPPVSNSKVGLRSWGLTFELSGLRSQVP